MRKINYDSATENISVFIQQRNISFQNDISLKTMRLGVFSWEKLKKWWDLCQNSELEPAGESKSNFWSLRHVYCLNESKSFKVGYRANLKHSKSTWRQLIVLWMVQNHNVKSSEHNARSAILDRGKGTIDLRQLSFWYRAFSWEPTNYEVCLSLSLSLIILFTNVQNKNIYTYIKVQ